MIVWDRNRECCLNEDGEPLFGVNYLGDGKMEDGFQCPYCGIVYTIIWENCVYDRVEFCPFCGKEFSRSDCGVETSE
jgi:hypothetical protein